MGHWNATTLGSDAAWDAIAGITEETDPAKIHAAFEDALAPPPSGDVFDEGESPYVLAYAELVAAGMGRPAKNLPERALPWVEAHGDLAAAFDLEALAAAETVGRSPYATMWVRDEGSAEFAAALDDLRTRLSAGRVKALKPPDSRFLDHVAAALKGDGWTLRKKDKTLRRPIEGGLQRVRFQMLGKHGLWSTTVRFEASFVEPQRIVFDVFERPDDPADSWLAMCILPPRAYHRSGNLRRLQLFRPQVSPPPTSELKPRNLKPRDLLNPEREVRVAAARAVKIVRVLGEKWFAAHAELEQFREVFERADREELRRLGPGAALPHHVAAGWMLDPAIGARILATRRAHLDEHEGPHIDAQREKLAALEAVLVERYGAPSSDS